VGEVLDRGNDVEVVGSHAVADPGSGPNIVSNNLITSLYRWSVYAFQPLSDVFPFGAAVF
jgi:hypothetical protein